MRLADVVKRLFFERLRCGIRQWTKLPVEVALNFQTIFEEPIPAKTYFRSFDVLPNNRKSKRLNPNTPCERRSEPPVAKEGSRETGLRDAPI